MRRCSACSKQFDDAVKFCPHDGSRLRASDLLSGGIVDGKYRIDGLLGEGGMGAVYRATQLQLERPVALKVVHGELLSDQTAVQRFKREALTVARLKHPHIVTVYDYGIAPDIGAYLVLELVEGRTLRQQLDRLGAPHLEYALELIRQICSAVGAAHAAGVIHRDLKPDNILLESGGEGPSVKVLDFGLAKLHTASDPRQHVTISGMVVGTPAYMSPEQCRGQILDARTDIYSLGCVFFEMLTGRPPFLGDDFQEFALKQTAEAPPSALAFNPSLSPAIDAVLQRALAKRPEDRFKSAGDLARALVAGSGSVQVQPTLQESPSIDPSTVGGAVQTTDAISATPNNLPQQMTSFVGRTRELGEVRGALAGARLLTLTGTGGIGKTQLALHVASSLLDEYPDGVWIVELAALTDPALVPYAIASTLGVREQPGRPLQATLSDLLRASRVLVLLDTCEHLVEACASLANTLLRACSQLRVLATSREALGVPGEQVWRVGGLTLPDPAESATPAAVADFESVRLFLDRVRLAAPGFALTEQNAPLVAKLCRQLDGIPLAIELAAARAKMLSVEQIVARLDDSFRLLTSGGRTTLPRQQTLRAAVDWSYSLLSEEERAVLGRLSVFAGSLTLDAALAVCADERVDEIAIADVLERLVDKSLLVIDPQGVEPRYRLLETIRQYAREKLAEAGDLARFRAVHARVFLDLARQAEGQLRGPQEEEWLSRLEADHDNLRAAFDWYCGEGADAHACLALSASLGLFWMLRGHWSEGRSRLSRALDAAAEANPSVRAHALHWAGVLASTQGDYAQARETLEACLVARRLGGDGADIALTLFRLGDVAQSLGDYAQAIARFEESLEMSRTLRDRMGVARALVGLGVIALDTGDFERAAERFEEAQGEYRALNYTRGIGLALHNLGRVAMRRGDGAKALALLDESLVIARDLGFKNLVAYSTRALGDLAASAGDRARARSRYAEAFEASLDLGDKRELALALDGLAITASAEGQPRRALVLAGAAEALRASIAAVIPATVREQLDRALVASRSALGDDESERALAEGRALPIDRSTVTVGLDSEKSS